jgi:hypothetical protein
MNPERLSPLEIEVLLHAHVSNAPFHRPSPAAHDAWNELAKLGLMRWVDAQPQGYWKTNALGDEWVERILRANAPAVISPRGESDTGIQILGSRPELDRAVNTTALGEQGYRRLNDGEIIESTDEYHLDGAWFSMAGSEFIWNQWKPKVGCATGFLPMRRKLTTAQDIRRVRYNEPLREKDEFGNLIDGNQFSEIPAAWVGMLPGTAALRCAFRYPVFRRPVSETATVDESKAPAFKELCAENLALRERLKEAEERAHGEKQALQATIHALLTSPIIPAKVADVLRCAVKFTEL